MFRELQRWKRRKILPKISISIGFGINLTASKRQQFNCASQLGKHAFNFNPDSVLRCAFREHTSGAR